MEMFRSLEVLVPQEAILKHILWCVFLVRVRNPSFKLLDLMGC